MSTTSLDGTQTAKPRLAVVAPTYRRVDGLRRLLEGLAGQTLARDEWEAIIVDDGSGPEAAGQIEQLAADAPFPVLVIHLDPGRGPAAARNAGWRAASADVIAFIDDDCVPRPGWLEAGMAEFTDPYVGVVQGRTVRPADSDGYSHTPFTVVREVLAPSPWFEACNVFYRRSALESVGGFDEKFGRFPCSEDTYLGWAVMGHDWERAWAGEAVVEHEITERPWTWHIRFHWREGELVRLAAEHPPIREWFWRPWAIKKENALFALAVTGAVASLRWRPAIVATLPYVWWLAPGHKVGAVGAAHQVSCHAASFAAKAGEGVRQGQLLL